MQFQFVGLNEHLISAWNIQFAEENAEKEKQKFHWWFDEIEFAKQIDSIQHYRMHFRLIDTNPFVFLA